MTKRSRAPDQLDHRFGGGFCFGGFILDQGEKTKGFAGYLFGLQAAEFMFFSAASISATTASAAAPGSSAWLIGRPTTR